MEIDTDTERYENGTIEQPKLTIRDSMRDDQGVYTCVCENDVGSSESTNSIYVNILRK